VGGAAAGVEAGRPIAMRKLIFFDIDGTIVSHTTNPSHIPEATLVALRQLSEAGHVVAFNTARSFATASRLMRELGITSAVLCSGAHIILDGKTVFLQHIDGMALKKAVQLAEKAKCTAYAADERNLYTLNVEESNLIYLAGQCSEIGMLKPLSRMKRACKTDIYGSFQPDVSVTDKACVIMENGSAGLLPPGISKAQGLEALAEYAGFSLEDTVAVGDSANDICMLKAAGVGVAVGNARDDVKEAADIVADKIEDGGIYNVFRQMGLI
jgi:HAD superfamily hydrolase (TIGR01484 family)